MSPRLTTVENANDKKVICYYTSWSSKRMSFGKFLPEDIDGELCTHIVYAFATLNIKESENRRNTPTFTLNVEDSTDIYRHFLNKAAEVRKKNGVKILLGLGGWNDSKENKYSRLADSSTIEQFAQYTAQFIQKHGFDGLHLNWQFPVCWQVNQNICLLVLSMFSTMFLLCILRKIFRNLVDYIKTYKYNYENNARSRLLLSLKLNIY